MRGDLQNRKTKLQDEDKASEFLEKGSIVIVVTLRRRVVFKFYDEDKASNLLRGDPLLLLSRCVRNSQDKNATHEIEG